MTSSSTRRSHIICNYLDRADVIPEIADKAAGQLVDFEAYDVAVLDIVFGKLKPTTKLPFELPRWKQLKSKRKWEQ